MLNFRQKTAVAAIALATSAAVQAQQDRSSTIEELTVYGEQGSSDAVTKLDISILETPQSITTISRAQLDDFMLTSVNDVLEYIPGVTVEEIETDRTYYTARGFDIVNFQYDGVGIPFIAGLNFGQQDTAIYEKVEVIKGAAGLVTGLANPSATINYVRKRPTESLEASAALTLGQWQNRRVDADVGGPISSKVGGRVVVAYDQGHSYLDRYEKDNQLFYGVLNFEITDTTDLTVGHSYDNSHSSGVLWGALPLAYTDGTATDYDVSTSTAPDWTFGDNTQEQTFVDFSQQLGDQWSLNAHVVKNQGRYDSELFYVYGTPERGSELGLNGWASAYARDETQDNADIFISGSFDLFGQNHELVTGYSYSDTAVKEVSRSDFDSGFPVLGADWAEGNTPAMDFESHDPATQTTDIALTQKAFYFATRLNLSDSVSALMGARNTELTQSGISYGGNAEAAAKETVPYYGITWEVMDNVVAYGSYSEVFKQQTWVDESLQPLGATLGDSHEFGVKTAFNGGKATLTVARFESEQANFGVFVGRNDLGIAIYEGRVLKSQGYEIELAGQVAEGLNIAAGYTTLDIDNGDGSETRTFIPKQSATLSSTYQLPALQALRLGGVIKWQDETSTPTGHATQDAFIRADLAVHYAVNDNAALSLNVQNVTDEKYLGSVFWDQAYYAAPRNVSVSLRWNY